MDNSMDNSTDNSVDNHKTHHPSGFLDNIRQNAVTLLDKYLNVYRQLYLEEFFMVFGILFLGIVLINHFFYTFNFLIPLLLILLLGAALITLIAYARELFARSLFRRIPLQAALTYGGYFIFFLLLGSIIGLNFNSFTSFVLFYVILYAAVTEFLVNKAENLTLIHGVQGEKLKFTSPRLKTALAVQAASSTRERIEQEVGIRMKAEQLRTELITNISHDIRTPLTSILNFAELLGGEDLQPEARDYLSVVHKSAQRMKVMVDDLFTATKTAAGNLKLEIETVDFSEVLMQTYAPIHSTFRDKGLELVYNRVDQTVPVRADGLHLSRVIQNLLTNAAKYSVDDTRVYVKVKDEPDLCRISLINVSREMLNITPDELMEQFVRGDQSRHTDGSGLGLYIATNLQRAMAGDLSLGIDGDVFTATLTLPKGQNAILGKAPGPAGR